MDQIMKRVQETETEILDVIHKICVDNNLKYSLVYGTLIGAIRHKGFIPWDDDIDLMMPRSDYDKFIDIWNQNMPKGYLLETEGNTMDLPINHMKIRKDHTAFVQNESEKVREHHKGIFVDIFPCDRIAPSSIGQKIQLMFCALYLLYNRGYTSRKSGLSIIPEKILLNIVPKKKYRSLSQKLGEMSRKWNDCQTDFIIPCTMQSCKIAYPHNVFEDLILKEFNGKQYYVTKQFDAVLRTEYGDYMQLPPEEERVWAHHPLIVDFEHNYEEIDDGDHRVK